MRKTGYNTGFASGGSNVNIRHFFVYLNFVARSEFSSENPARTQSPTQCGETPLRYVSPHRVGGLHPLDVLRKASHIKRICEIEKKFPLREFFSNFANPPTRNVVCNFKPNREKELYFYTNPTFDFLFKFKKTSERTLLRIYIQFRQKLKK